MSGRAVFRKTTTRGQGTFEYVLLLGGVLLVVVLAIVVLQNTFTQSAQGLGELDLKQCKAAALSAPSCNPEGVFNPDKTFSSIDIPAGTPCNCEGFNPDAKEGGTDEQAVLSGGKRTLYFAEQESAVLDATKALTVHVLKRKGKRVFLVAQHVLGTTTVFSGKLTALVPFSKEKIQSVHAKLNPKIEEALDGSGLTVLTWEKIRLVPHERLAITVDFKGEFKDAKTEASQKIALIRNKNGPTIAGFNEFIYPSDNAATPPLTCLSVGKSCANPFGPSCCEGLFCDAGSGFTCKAPITASPTASPIPLITSSPAPTASPIPSVSPTFRCPQYFPPGPDFCKAGQIVPGGFDGNGCLKPPACIMVTLSPIPIQSPIPTPVASQSPTPSTAPTTKPEEVISQIASEVDIGGSTTLSGFFAGANTDPYEFTYTYTAVQEEKITTSRKSQVEFASEDTVNAQPITRPPAIPCPAYVDPVCGKDGKTYSNSCFAENSKVEFTKGACLVKPGYSLILAIPLSYSEYNEGKIKIEPEPDIVEPATGPMSNSLKTRPTSDFFVIGYDREFKPGEKFKVKVKKQPPHKEKLETAFENFRKNSKPPQRFIKPKPTGTPPKTCESLEGVCTFVNDAVIPDKPFNACSNGGQKLDANCPQIPGNVDFPGQICCTKPPVKVSPVPACATPPGACDPNSETSCCAESVCRQIFGQPKGKGVCIPISTCALPGKTCIVNPVDNCCQGSTCNQGVCQPFAIPIPKEACFDSDKGNFPTVFGEIILNGKPYAKDFCNFNDKPPNTKVNEFWCDTPDAKTVSSTWTSCRNGCDNGACKPVPSLPPAPIPENAMKINDEKTAANGLRITLINIVPGAEDNAKNPIAVINIYDPNKKLIDTANLGVNHQFNKHGINIQVPTINFAMEPADRYAIISLTITNPTPIPTPNCLIRLPFLQVGCQPTPSPTPKPSVEPSPGPGPSFDTLTFSTGKQSFLTSTTDTRTVVRVSYVLVQSSLVAPFDFGNVKTNSFYYITDSIAAGKAVQGMIFYRDPTNGIFVPFLHPKNILGQNGQIAINKVKYTYGAQSVDLIFNADGIETGTNEPDFEDFVIFVPDGIGGPAFQIDVGYGDQATPRLGSSTKAGVAYG